VFQKGSDVGVTSALLDEGMLDDEAMRTDIPNVSVMPAGPIPPNPAELFHSERFKSLLEKLSRRFDRVIIDSPPVVAVTDAAILSTLVDGTVLVARAFKTQRDVARYAVRSLLDVGGKVAGVVLNAVDLDRQEYRYYHYYAYKKDGYYGRKHDAERKSEPPPSERSAAPPH
jgi:capsular exopolysaccharide synthesis family protein